MKLGRVSQFVLIGSALLIAIQFGLFQTFMALGLLPDPVAIHWGLSGEPDGFAGLEGYLFGITLTYVALWSLMAFSLLGIKRRLLRPMLFTIAAFVLLLGLMVISVTLLAQLGRSAADTYLGLEIIAIVVVLPLAIVVVVLGRPVVVLADQLQVRVRGLTLLTLDFDELTGVEQTTLRIRDYGGAGIRYARKTLAFLPNAGKGILLRTNFGESVAIRTNEAESLALEISQRIGK